ncbi:hypothetical protein QYM36_000596 [Artemia franciscana]|uniref:Uncharacterized protein n=1 Tax=Artemia franciscana TaxID=6661 RepID=A0AA88LL77_ARTSF|nr:hypothetical protein QYM36_000596 [Artemia franciscana]
MTLLLRTSGPIGGVTPLAALIDIVVKTLPSDTTFLASIPNPQTTLMIATAALAFILTVCGAALATIYQVLPRLIRPNGPIIGTPGLSSLPVIGSSPAFGSAFAFPGLPLFPNLPPAPNPNIPVDQPVPNQLSAVPNLISVLPIDVLERVAGGLPPAESRELKLFIERRKMQGFSKIPSKPGTTPVSSASTIAEYVHQGKTYVKKK